ncbi:hypothetical protein CAAN1_01S03466 [[Candida] anglica]|uniref:Uncharacterized protein n=1 Tax=[Candida] anglica TaxID=148631 RepID=A0ABP0EM84_9ASCO
MLVTTLRIPKGFSMTRVAWVRQLSSKPPSSASSNTTGTDDNPNTPGATNSTPGKKSSNNVTGSEGKKMRLSESDENHELSSVQETGTLDSRSPSNRASTTSKYISFKDFPRAPAAIRKSSTDSLLGLIDRRAFYSQNEQEQKDIEKNISEATKPVEVRPYHSFQIPKQFLKGHRDDEIERILNEINDYSSSFIPSEFVDLTRPPFAEHPLKRSWSNLMPLNPGLHSISNEYLWEIVPENKLFKSPPFESVQNNKNEDVLFRYKNWEEQKKKEKTKQLQEKLNEQKETDEAVKEFQKNNSFFAVSGGRKKLNRNLVKKFRKLKQEGKLGKNTEDED